ncbi:TlpA family protein disulfide reductase [Hyunsoonleella aestuarii]|uniref:Thioredoxin domain-containing protein n=1 Tax=Hyunsoonleella aestuarii TaxID=912802 RepID=A0ABP8E8R8_9FLAO|nr:TlpA disulfide reductase family protein [Hyunsoonleella aestuarii]
MQRLLIIFVFFPSFLLAQHSIKGVFSPKEDYNFAILYKVTPTISEYVSNAEIQGDGSFQFQLDSTYTKGIYRLVYAVPQEDYNFDIIYNGKEDVELTFNSETGVKFDSSLENKLLESYTNSMLMITNSIGNYFRDESKDKDTLALTKIFKTQKETQSNFEEASKGSIASNFIKANKPFIPKSSVDVKTYVQKLEKHYFDHVDFNNSVLQSSNFLTERMLNYVFGNGANSQDEIANYKKNINTLYQKINSSPDHIKKNLLSILWQQMADLNIESVANFIADTYLMDLAVSSNDQELLRALILYNDISIGKIAPDFEVETKEKDKTITKKLSQLNIAENYIVVFWSTTCSHCLDEIPQLQNFIKSVEKNKVKVVAIALEDESYNWKNLTYDYPEFIHIYGDGKWNNDIGNRYGVTATPSYFVLNAKKQIVAKPEDCDMLKEYFQDGN